METGTVLFTEKHLQSFRVYSKDENLLHTDKEYASRTPFSDRVLYGVASAFFLLSKSEIKKIDIRSLKIDFKKPVMLNKTYNFLIEKDGSKYFLKIFKGKSIYTIVKIETMYSEEQKSVRFSLNSIGVHSLLDKNPHWNTLPDDTGKKELFKNYPGLESVHEWLLKILAWSSYWVGMVAPGRQAIFTQFELLINENNLNFNYDRNEVHDLLKRYKSCFKTDSGSSITMFSFSRPKPLEYLQDSIFKDTNNSLLKDDICFVTGGTRGVGSVFSQLFASRSATCFASYFRNEITAKRIEEFIQSKGKSFRAIKLDNQTKLFDKFQGSKLSCLVLNAAPGIKKIHPSELSESEFQAEFNQFYNLAMRDVYQFKDYLAKDATIINISTTYIDEKPEGFAHYYEAKKAIENELLKFSKKYPQLTILNYRLPKMLTDQTNTNDLSNIAISPVKVIDMVFKDYLARRSHSGFYTLDYDIEKLYEGDIKHI